MKDKKTLPEGKTWFDLELEKVPKSYINLRKIAIIDCDGVLTDGKSLYDNKRKAYKTYGAYDKEMMNFLSKSFNWQYIFISDDRAGMDITMNRVEHLMKSNPNISFSPVGVKERPGFIQSLKPDYDITMFIGDSLSDITCMSLADYAGCPKNAAYQVKEYCNYSSNLCGADGGLADILWNLHVGIYEKYKEI